MDKIENYSALHRVIFECVGVHAYMCVDTRVCVCVCVCTCVWYICWIMKYKGPEGEFPLWRSG